MEMQLLASLTINGQDGGGGANVVSGFRLGAQGVDGGAIYQGKQVEG